GTARLLNVFLGASPTLIGVLSPYNNSMVVRIILVSASVFLYVLAITILSRKEISSTTSINTVVGVFLIIFAVIATIVFAGFVRVFQIDLVISLILFIVIIIVTFK